MSALSVQDLLRHQGHKVVVAQYAKRKAVVDEETGEVIGKRVVSVTIECETCYEVLLEVRDSNEGQIEIGAIDEN